jgi:hypothetical protein
MTRYVMIYKAMRHVTLPRMRELSPAPISVAQNKRSLLSEQPSHYGFLGYNDM